MEDTNLATPETTVAQAYGVAEVETLVDGLETLVAAADAALAAAAPAPEATPSPTAAGSEPQPEEPQPEPSLLDRLEALGVTMPLIGRVLAGDPTFTVGDKTYRFQMSFMAQGALLKDLGAQNPEDAGRILEERFASDGDPLGQLDIAVGALRAALLRHHGEVTQDELSDLFAELAAEEVGQLLASLGAYFQTHDGLGDYFAGKDPLIRLTPPNPEEIVPPPSKAYVLRWTMAEMQEVMKEISDLHGPSLSWRDCRRVLVRALKRFQPTGVSVEELDDLGWFLGMGGIRRLMAGPQRKKDRPADPNASGPATAGPGTGTPS